MFVIEKKKIESPRLGMVLVPAGKFSMGSKDGGEFESPIHQVNLDDFWMDETPVTNASFARFVKETGHQTEAEKVGEAWGYHNGQYALIPNLSWQTYATSDRDNHPVVLVSWHDAFTYAQWAGKRLPTEAEWEKAARGGLEDRIYPWGNQEPNGRQCNFAQTPLDIPPTTDVKQFSPNNYGLYDMVGNVWQWCSDWYESDHYQHSLLNQPTGGESGTHRVRRGASWNVIQSFRLRCANRGAFAPNQVAPNVGFRCVL
jgi:formylglycine-generating enzyme